MGVELWVTNGWTDGWGERVQDGDRQTIRWMDNKRRLDRPSWKMEPAVRDVRKEGECNSLSSPTPRP